MNISQPIASAVEAVEFACLSAEEVRAISVRRIDNESTFDTLLNPVPGGLYDPALGSWGDSVCTTCNLAQSSCPGHAGHIELPVPVYHPMFMDQAFRLLRAQCSYCHQFRLPRKDVHRYTCMLRLLQYGLLSEARMIEAIGQDFSGMALDGVPQGETSGSDEEDPSSVDGVIRARNVYVLKVLGGRTARVGQIRQGKHEGASEARRELIRDFLSEMVKSRLCAGCGGISPAYRKDHYVKIFEKPLTPKDKAKMAQGKYKLRDAVTISQKPQSKADGYTTDEGIADIDLPSGDEEEEEVEEEGDGDDLDENGDVIQGGPRTKPKRPRPSAQGQRYISAMEVLRRLNLLFEREQEIISLLYNSKPPQKNAFRVTADMFFLQTLLVPPNRYRPEARMGDSQITEAQQNSLYKMILRSSSKVAQISREVSGSQKEGSEADGGRQPRGMASLHEAWTELQDCVNSLVDRNKNPIQGAAAKRNEDGIKQKLEKKEGLFRKNMMGKRVNYAARSVISPDPNIETNEIGVPPVFASRLTYPEPVTSHNFKDMQQAVVNGVDKWPGASAIENENGQVINLRGKSLEDRVSLANQLLAPTSNNFSGIRNKKVHRHLTNGDVVLMNRQPTLHKPSIMGHRVRVLPGEKTIRMHYANCNTYNADFDGDEMNMHFPQNEIARAEALQLADTDHQYISATQGKPLRGLIQDHLSVSVALCSKDTFFDKGTYNQLVYAALRPESGHISGERIKVVPPAFLKPAARWTGKQVVTTILRNIKPPNCGDLWMDSKTQVSGYLWGEGSEEGSVVFQDGEFITGILDKSQLGPSSGGLVHSVHEVYGPAVAGKFLSSMGRLLTRYLNMRAFTCGMDDLRLTAEGEAARRRELEAARHVGLEVAAKYVSVGGEKANRSDPELLARLEEVMRDDSKQEGLDLLMTKTCGSLSSRVTAACLPAGLTKQFPKNQMQSMTNSGAKGSSVNANLISCNLGQQVLEGRRVPLMVSGKSLPSFEPFDTDVRAGGYVVNRFLTGIRPQEYYFHHMAGREGLIDTAVKTSRSGYLQRCLIKGMEGLQVAYDTSVRDSDGTLIQFLYGEDGLDITRQKFLTNFRFLLQNLESQFAQVKFLDPSTHILFDRKDELVKKMKKAVKSAREGSLRAQDPVNSYTNPARFAFATSERFFVSVANYLQNNADGLVREKGSSRDPSGETHKLARKAAEKLLVAKYARSLVEPGEAVGIVAGQSVGEPSTQMTLNTFHLAGHSAKNVTLGIPRLREILMTASTRISTPTMTLVLNEEMSRQDGERFAKGISVLPLSHVVNRVSVSERVDRGMTGALAKIYDVRLYLFPSTEYTKTYAIGIADVLGAIERKFLPLLHSLVTKEIKKRGGNNSATPEIGLKAGVVEMAAAETEDGQTGVDGEEDDDDGEDDATNAKQRENRNEAVSYGPNDAEDDAIQRQMEREGSPDDFMTEDEAYGGSPPPPGRDEDDERRAANEEAARDGREERAKVRNHHVSQFRCDEEKGEWCRFTLELHASTPKIIMLNLVQEAVTKSLVQQIPGIGACTFVPEEKLTDFETGDKVNTPVVHTVGSNLRAVQKYGEFINPNKILTNDIAAVLEIYGVEACRNNIIRELGSVFGGHGISVDNRHLNLIGDYMTRNGGFTPFNRIGLAGNVSPFTKMSFETTVSFLRDAVLDGDWDCLRTPSSRLVMGQLSHVGTGAFDVLTQVPMRHQEHKRS